MVNVERYGVLVVSVIGLMAIAAFPTFWGFVVSSIIGWSIGDLLYRRFQVSKRRFYDFLAFVVFATAISAWLSDQYLPQILPMFFWNILPEPKNQTLTLGPTTYYAPVVLTFWAITLLACVLGFVSFEILGKKEDSQQSTT